MKQTPVYEANKPSRFGTATALFTILIAIFLIAFGTVYYLRSQKTDDKIDAQIAQTKALVQEVKTLSEENKKLNQTGVNYAYCNAYLLALYTQTKAPITIEDLNSCVVTSFPNSDTAPTIPTKAFQDAQNNIQGTSSSTPQSTTTPSSSTARPSTSPTTTPTSPTTPTNNPQQTSGVTLQPSAVLPILEIVPKVKIPGILEIR